MNCDRYKRLMQEVLDGEEEGKLELDSHLAECQLCRAEWRELRRLVAALQADAPGALEPEQRERAIPAVMAAVRLLQRRTALGRVWTRAAMAAALPAIVFGLGLLVGRECWPREVTVREFVKVPEVREKVVRVHVPVVKERIVERRVPVERERVVYRQRSETEAPSLPPEEHEPEVPVVHYDQGAVPGRYPSPQRSSVDDYPVGQGEPHGERELAEEMASPGPHTPPVVYGIPPDFDDVTLASVKGEASAEQDGHRAWQ